MALHFLLLFFSLMARCVGQEENPYEGISLDSSAGILVVGGDTTLAHQSVEFWSAADPEQGSCALDDYPREMQESPTVNLVSGHLVACLYDTCENFDRGSWQHLQDTSASRRLH